MSYLRHKKTRVFLSNSELVLCALTDITLVFRCGTWQKICIQEDKEKKEERWDLSGTFKSSFHAFFSHSLILKDDQQLISPYDICQHIVKQTICYWTVGPGLKVNQCLNFSSIVSLFFCCEYFVVFDISQIQNLRTKKCTEETLMKSNKTGGILGVSC